MIDPFGGSQIPDRLLMAQDKKRIWILAVLFLIVLASFLGIQIWAQSQSKKDQEKAAGKPETVSEEFPIDTAPKRDPEGRAVFNVQARTVQDKRDLAEDDMATRLGELAAEDLLVDGRKEESPKVLDYLLKQALWEFRITSLPPYVYRRLAEEKAAHEPSPYRGTLTSAFGELTWVGPMEDYPTEVKEVKALQRAEFRTAEGSIYHFVSTTDVEFKVGQWTQVYGIFYRTRPSESVEGKAAFCLVLTKKPAKGYPPTKVTEIDSAWAEQVRDENYTQANEVNERPFWLLLNYSLNLGIEGYRKRKDAGEIEVLDFLRVARPLVRRVEQYRLEHIAASGKLITPRVEYFDTDNAGKIERLDSAILLQPSGYFVHLASPRPWEDYDIRVGHDFVRVEGVFYKRWQYVPKGSTTPLEIPLVVVTDIVPVDQGKNEVMEVLKYVFLGLAVVIVGAFLTFSLKDRRARAAFRERVREKTAARMADGGGTEEE
jgi:hypothetical protein